MSGHQSLAPLLISEGFTFNLFWLLPNPTFRINRSEVPASAYNCVRSTRQSSVIRLKAMLRLECQTIRSMTS